MRNAPKIGDFVRSRFRRRWYGRIVGKSVYVDGCYLVKQLFSHRGASIRKGKVMTLSHYWLEVLDNHPLKAL
jgi:hypothetical protein